MGWLVATGGRAAGTRERPPRAGLLSLFSNLARPLCCGLWAGMGRVGALVLATSLHMPCTLCCGLFAPACLEQVIATRRSVQWMMADERRRRAS